MSFPPEIESEPDRLTRIEAKLNWVIGKIEAFETTVAPVLANPGRLLAKMMGGGK